MLMVTCFIVGMGVPTAPAYIIVAVARRPGPDEGAASR